jgi:hypothetical protein
MKFYVQKKDDIVIAYGCSSELPDGVTEITEEEYNAGLAALAEADEKAQKEREAKEQAERLAREKEAAERQAKIDDYVSKVRSGTLKIEDVPEEYRDTVNSVINPPKTETERILAVEEQTANIQSAMDDLMMMVAGTATESEG